MLLVLLVLYFLMQNLEILVWSNLIFLVLALKNIIVKS